MQDYRKLIRNTIIGIVIGVGVVFGPLILITIYVGVGRGIFLSIVLALIAWFIYTRIRNYRDDKYSKEFDRRIGYTRAIATPKYHCKSCGLRPKVGVVFCNHCGVRVKDIYQEYFWNNDELHPDDPLNRTEEETPNYVKIYGPYK